MDPILRFFNYFDHIELLFVIIPLVWLGFGRRLGMRLFFLLALSTLFNGQLKALFELPRPYFLDPSVGLLEVKGHGFPSGGAQTAFVLSGFLVLHTKGIWRWFVALFYTLLISMSRLLLGVHFPIDILGGWVSGLMVLTFYNLYFDWLVHFFNRRAWLGYLLILIAMWLYPAKTLYMGATAAGFGASALLYHFMNIKEIIPEKNNAIYWLRILIGIFGVFAIYLFFRKSIIGFFLIGLWISFGAAFLFERFGKLSRPQVL